MHSPKVTPRNNKAKTSGSLWTNLVLINWEYDNKWHWKPVEASTNGFINTIPKRWNLQNPLICKDKWKLITKHVTWLPICTNDTISYQRYKSYCLLTWLHKNFLKPNNLLWKELSSSKFRVFKRKLASISLPSISTNHPKSIISYYDVNIYIYIYMHAKLW